MQSPAPAPTLKSIQAARGIAALAVVLYHTVLIAGQNGVNYPGFITHLSAFGNLGVNLFFVLSGFIIMMAHEKDVGRPARTRRYLYRRAIRIYPLYWVLTTVYVAAAYVGFGSPNFSWAWDQMLSFYALIHVTHPQSAPPLTVAWTLLYEMRFYLMFVSFLIGWRLGVTVFSAWAAVILGGWLTSDKELTGFASLYNLHFFGGILLYYLVKKLRHFRHAPKIATGALAASAGMAGVMITLTYGNHIDPYAAIPYAGPVFFLFLMGVVLLEWSRPFNFNRWLLWMGDASYSIYLSHSAVLSALAIFSKKLHLPLLSGVPGFVFAVAACLIAGGVIYRLIEKPLLDRLR